MPRFDVFISYERADRALAEELVQDLRNVGLRVWVDWEQIAPGEEWLYALHRGLEASDATALLVGATGLSPWQRKEASQALARHVTRGSRIVAVFLPGVSKPKRSLPFLDLNQWIECDVERGPFRGPLNKIVWAITGVRQVVQRDAFGEEYLLSVEQPPYRRRQMTVLTAPTRGDAVTSLTWRDFGRGIDLLISQIRNYGYRITCDACFGINDAGAIIAASLNGAVFASAPSGYVKARWAGNEHVRILPESVFPPLKGKPVIVLATFEVKQGNAVTAVVRRLREKYDDPRIYYVVFSALTKRRDFTIESVDDLAAGAKLAQLRLADIFIGCTTALPGLQAPLGLR